MPNETFKKIRKAIFNSIPLPENVKDSIRKKFDKKQQKFDGWMRIYLTFKCTVKCRYCVNEFWPEADKKFDYQLLNGKDWVKIINKTKRNVVFTGGEPFLHPDFIEIINGIDRSIDVKIYTNFTCDVDDFTRKATREVNFFGSYHPCSGPPEKFLSNINKLRDAGKFNGSIHAILSETQVDFVTKTVSLFKEHGWELLLGEDQYTLFESASKKFRKKVKCKRNIILIAPDGTRYPCVSKMVRHLGGQENLLDEPLRKTWITCICDDYGYCAPCDGLGENKTQMLE